MASVTDETREDGPVARADGARAPARARTLVCTAAYCAQRGLDPAAVPLVLPDERDLLWLDLEAPTVEELQAVASSFDFHPLAVEDATLEHQRAKIDQYESFYFLVLFGISYNQLSNGIDERELDVFLGPNYLV